MSAAGIGVYIHWPYCTRICPYCDFNVVRARGAEVEPLLEAVLADLSAHAAWTGPRRVETIYFGGGTPSLLEARQVERLIDAVAGAYDLARDAEITLEANPDERAKFADFVAAGVNRISVGAQALRNPALAALGRSHDAEAARDAVEQAFRVGARTSADFIYARAGQALDAWEAELRDILALPAEHFSLYELTIKSGTAFERAVQRGAFVPPGDELAAQFYERTQELCDAAGAPAYEISNHARTPAAQARHNLIYWRNGEWLGLGPGAHGRLEREGERWATKAVDAPAAYIARVAEAGHGWASAESLSAEARGEERVIMGLRADAGVARAGLSETAIAEMIDAGLLAASADRVALTRAGRLLADRIAAELLR